MAAFAFLGVIFVLASQSGGLVSLKEATFDGLPLQLAAGLGLALTAAFVTAFTGFSWVWSHNSVNHQDIPEPMRKLGSKEHLEMLLLLVALVLSNLAAAPMNGAIGLALWDVTGEGITPRGFLLAATAGGLGYGAASVMWRRATTLTANLGIHAMSYAPPPSSPRYFSPWPEGRAMSAPHTSPPEHRR